MYKLQCIIYNDHHLMHCSFCYVKFWKSGLCSNTTATSRKLVTNRLYVAIFSLILIPRLSRHLHENCYTWYLWRLNVHDICFVRFGTGVPELYPFLKLVYPYRESLCLKLLQQFSCHLLNVFMVYLISFDKVEIGVYTHHNQW